MAVPKSVRKSPPAKPGPVIVAAKESGRIKHKIVRDSFTIPKAEYDVLGRLKERAVQLRRPVKKSELLRAGITALEAMPDKAFLEALNAVPAIKTGRPKAEIAADPPAAAAAPRGAKARARPGVSAVARK